MKPRELHIFGRHSVLKIIVEKKLPSIARAMFLFWIVGASGLIQNSEAENRGARELQIIETTPLRFSTRVSDIPAKVLNQTGLIRSDEQLVSLMVDAGEKFSTGDEVVPGLVSMMLNFVGVSRHYIVLCYMKGGRGLSGNLILIGDIDTIPKVVLRAYLFGECKSVADVEERLRRGEFQPISSLRRL
jgi:hypothetical protein